MAKLKKVLKKSKLPKGVYWYDGVVPLENINTSDNLISAGIYTFIDGVLTKIEDNIIKNTK